MIHKMSSQDFNNILKECKDNIERTRVNVVNIKNEIEVKTLITGHEIEYTTLLLKENGYASKDEEFIPLSNNISSISETYSAVTHAAFKRQASNVFNLKALNSEYDFFRDEVDVSINGIKNSHFKNILKSEQVKDKEIFFEERKDFSEIKASEVEDIDKVRENGNLIKLEMEINIERAVGISKFNMIEIDPFLMGSFNIKSIEIFEEDENKAAAILPEIERCGKTRIILDKKYLFKKVRFNIEPKYKTTVSAVKIIPFGIKHIFFLDADFRTDSKVIVKYTSSKYIDCINNTITLLTPFGKKESLITKENIKIFLDYKNNVLENEHQSSEFIKNPIARNINTIYFEIPLKRRDDENFLQNSISAIKFSIETR